MKKIIGFLAVAALASTACSKEHEPTPGTPPDGDGAKAAIYFASTGTADAGGTRAFGAGTTETWEKTIDNATVLVFNAAGNIKFRRDLSAAEIANAKTTPVSLVIPDVAVGDNCDFAVVANRTVAATVTTKAMLLAEEESDAAAYNGLFTDVTTKALRLSGFVMTGMATQAIAAGTTNVALTLKRIVAKVEVAAATTPAFTNKYGPATVTVNKITLTRGSLKSYLMDQSPAKYSAGGSTFTHAQNASAGKNLFYIFEKAAAAAGARVLLTLDATYDADGSAATTADQVPLSYEVELTGASGGKVLRNGSYLVNISIDGLTGQDVAMTVETSNWETIVTDAPHVGN